MAAATCSSLSAGAPIGKPAEGENTVSNTAKPAADVLSHSPATSTALFAQLVNRGDMMRLMSHAISSLGGCGSGSGVVENLAAAWAAVHAKKNRLTAVASVAAREVVQRGSGWNACGHVLADKSCLGDVPGAIGTFEQQTSLSTFDL